MFELTLSEVVKVGRRKRYQSLYCMRGDRAGRSHAQFYASGLRTVLVNAVFRIPPAVKFGHDVSRGSM